MRPNIIIIQKRTAYERYGKQGGKTDFIEYLRRDGQTPKTLLDAHSAHCKTREALLSYVKRRGLKYHLWDLDTLWESGHSFYDGFEDDGLYTRDNLILSLGGDGTLLQASHYIGGDQRLMGINSSPQTSVGHLCAAKPEGMLAAVEIALENQDLYTAVPRLKMETLPTRVRLPFAMNDVLFCNLHPAATSRYQISILSQNNDAWDVLGEEKHISSGVWVAAPAGHTAAIASYGLGSVDLVNPSFLYAIREPYQDSDKPFALLQGILRRSQHKIKLFSRMRNGLICVDGPDFSTSLGFGETAEISLPEEGNLRLVTAADILLNRS